MFERVQTNKNLYVGRILSVWTGSWGQVALEETYLLLKWHSIVQYFRND